MSDMPAVGSIRLYDEARPSLPAGDYVLESALAIEQGGGPLDAPPAHRMFFSVQAPLLRLEPGDVADCHPAPQARGSFANQLPHAVLGRRSLPWERSGPGGIPWLALLVVAQGEGLVEAGTVAGLPQPVRAALGAPDTAPATLLRCTSGQMLYDLLPERAEVPLLTHVRQVNLRDSTLAGADDDGWFAVVTANRLPLYTGKGTAYTACLVSLQARDDLWLLDRNAPAPALLVLHAWSFVSTATGGTFEDMMRALSVQGFALPLAAADPAAPAPVDAAGCVPLQRRDRHGEPHDVHYRGPLRGLGEQPFSVEEADISRASAVELGRLLGNADARFLREVVVWHRAAEARERGLVNIKRLTEALKPLLGEGPIRPVRPRALARAGPGAGQPAAMSASTSAISGAGTPTAMSMFINASTSTSTTTRAVAGALSQHIAARLAGDLPRARLWQRPEEGGPE